MNFMNLNYESLGKEGLRTACREAGIKYGRMNNDQMRTALRVERGRLEGSTLTKAPKAKNGHATQNGIRQPGEGTKCRAVWDELDGMADIENPDGKRGRSTVTIQDARDMAENAGWNMNNTVIEFYQWRKFHGIFGRRPVRTVN